METSTNTLNNRTIQTGNLSQLEKITYDDILTLTKVLPEYKETLLSLLYVFHSESDLVRFLDLFAGTTLKLPPRTKIYHAIRKINIYKYYTNLANNSDSSTEQLLYTTAKHFQLTKQYITTIIEFMSSINNS